MTSAGVCWCGCHGSLSEVTSSVAATTQLPASRHQLSHARVAIDNVFPATAAGSGHEGMIELRDGDDDYPGWSADRQRGWSEDSRQEMTSWDLPLYFTPKTFHESDWQLHYIDLRTSYE